MKHLKVALSACKHLLHQDFDWKFLVHVVTKSICSLDQYFLILKTGTLLVNHVYGQTQFLTWELELNAMHIIFCSQIMGPKSFQEIPSI